MLSLLIHASNVDSENQVNKPTNNFKNYKLAMNFYSHVFKYKITGSFHEIL